jgi:2'-hydroxyisoflavone reductase
MLAQPPAGPHAGALRFAYIRTMHLLFIGGTRFVGRAMVEQALRRGHRVDVFHRGRTAAGAPPGARHLIGDRNGDLSALAGGHWDATLDICGYRPGEIEALSAALGDRGGRQVFVSSISAYADDLPAHSDESAALADTAPLQCMDLATLPIDATSYGALKVLCESALRARHADPLILRPTYVIGPHDPTPRFPEWVRRIAAGGVVDAPEPRDEPIQMIDARDLAAFAIDAVERGTTGSFNVAGPAAPLTWGGLLDALVAAIGPPGTTLHWKRWADVEAAAAMFPMWGQGAYSGLSAVHAGAALAHGLRCRPLAESARDVRDGLRATLR